MKLFLTYLFSIFVNQLISQPIKNLFKIDTTQFSTIKNSLYNQLQVIDNRENETDFGIVSYDKRITPSLFSSSELTRYEGIKIQKPIKNQLEEVFSKQLTKNAQEGKLLLVLNRMYFSDPDALQTGQNDVAFSFSANLFVVENENYSLLATLDSNLSKRVLPLIQSTNKPLIKKASKIVFNFIESNLQKKPVLQTKYSDRDIRKWDSVIKSSIKLYNSYELPDGIYYTYNDFKNQISNGKPIIKLDSKGRLRKVFAMNDKRTNGIKIDKKKFYAVVQNGKTFVSVKTNSLKWQYLILEREGNDCFVKARKIFNGNLNFFYQVEVRNKNLSVFDLKRMPIMKFKLEPSNGSFTPVDLSKSVE